jgi:hypothetical protein
MVSLPSFLPVPSRPSAGRSGYGFTVNISIDILKEIIDSRRFFNNK